MDVEIMYVIFVRQTIFQVVVEYVVIKHVSNIQPLHNAVHVVNKISHYKMKN
jgi:hypothetical protein